MKLTTADQQILDGKNGPAAQKAMELIVRYGQVAGANELCTITWADLFCGCHDYLDVTKSDDFDTVFSKMALCTPGTVRLEKMSDDCICYSGVEPDCTEVPEEMFMSADKQKTNLAFLSRFVDAGVNLSGNCIPYLTGFIPIMGDHFVSCESSAVLFMNSLWGARGNGDGIEASFCAAVCGRTPKSGMHVKKNRAATVEVKINTAPKTRFDWDRLGYALGALLPPHAIPVFTGNFPKPDAILLKTFFASLACAAGTEMCHLPGITPESEDLDTAFQGRKDYDTLVVEDTHIKEGESHLTGNASKSVDYITIGCPHLHVEELRQIAAFLDGRQVHPDTWLDIWTTGPMLYMAQRSGAADAITKAGAHLVTGGCPSNRGYPTGTRTVAFDSTKQRQDAPADLGNANLFYGSRQTCLLSAISGKWAG